MTPRAQQHAPAAHGRADQGQRRDHHTQAAKVLDPARTEIRYNSEWNDALGTRGMIQLAAKYTVARMMERNDFHQRFTEGSSISLHEFCTRCCRAMTRGAQGTWSWGTIRSSTC